MKSRFNLDGKRVSLLGYGAMRQPAQASAKTGIDQKRLNAQVRRLLDGGVTYFDTSPVYSRGFSEITLGEALAASGYQRKDYILATKLSNFAEQFWTLDACKQMFENSLKCLRTDYIDNYLIHSIGGGGMARFSKRYLDNGALDWCVRLRDEGHIRNLGFSFHGDKKTWDWCLAHHDRYKWDFVQIQMNYVDWLHAGEGNTNAKTLYDELAALKIPAVIMEPLLGGRLARYNWSIANELTPLDPEASLAQWAFRFCGSFDNVLTILSGLSEEAHIEEDLRIFASLEKCSPRELEALERAAQAFLSCNSIPCNNCNYCMPCPYGLDIPAILTFRNLYLTKDEGRKTKELLKLYEQAVPEPLRRADHCTGCGRCRPHCPQQIDIAKEIASIDAVIDELKSEVVK